MLRRSTFAPEFRLRAVDLVITTGRTAASVAEELGMSERTLSSWVRQERANEDRVSWPAISALEREELRRMRARDREVWIERLLPEAGSGADTLDRSQPPAAQQGEYPRATRG